jgi:hypothetical protein
MTDRQTVSFHKARKQSTSELNCSASDLRNSRAVEEEDDLPATPSQPYSWEPVTKSRTLEHRGSQTLRFYCIPHITEHMVKDNVMITSLEKKNSGRCGSTTKHAMAMPFQEYIDYIWNYIPSSAKTMSLNDLKIRNNKMFTWKKKMTTNLNETVPIIHAIHNKASKLHSTWL